MHVAQISFFNDPEGRTPEQLLEAWPSLVDVAEAAARAGVRVTVLQACAYTRTVMRDGVSYEFLPLGRGSLPAASGERLGERLQRLSPDVLHVHGLGFARDVLELAALCPGRPILLQDHANRLPRPWRRRLWRRGLAAAAAVSFCALEQAQPFVHAGLIQASTQLLEIPECPSRFNTGDQAAARHATGLAGDPCLLWVGHLDRNKDPLTVLSGVSAVVARLPRLQLWCCYGTAPLLAEVRERISSDANLRGRVHLLGRVPHERVEQLMRAADMFVLGSHREGSGYSVIESLACGLPPVVSDIPSFHSLTAGGTVGALWRCGDAGAFSEALLSVASRPGVRVAARAHFERELSLEAVGAKLAAAYRGLLL